MSSFDSHSTHGYSHGCSGCNECSYPRGETISYPASYTGTPSCNNPRPRSACAPDEYFLRKQECFSDRAEDALTYSPPPTGMRLSRILGMFRVHARSVGRQIGPKALRDFVEQIISHDLHDQHYRES